jgi:hypothetical protein
MDEVEILEQLLEMARTRQIRRDMTSIERNTEMVGVPGRSYMETHPTGWMTFTFSMTVGPEK